MKTKAANFVVWRFYVVIVFILLVVAGLVARLIDLTVLDRHFLLSQGDARTLRTVNVPAFRGMITDRNNYPLAISTTVYSVWVDPSEFVFTSHDLHNLSSLLNVKPADIQNTISAGEYKQQQFVYLKRGVSPELAQEIKALHISGINLQEDFKRYYPEGEVAAHVVGFTNIDDSGTEGLELAYNKWLSGMAGKKQVIKDRLGREVSNIKTYQTQKHGEDLTLSIDKRIQYVAYRELMAGVIKNSAVSGSIVVLDIKTGEVLAMANFPSYNPNNRPGKKSDIFRNRAVTDLFEPGSVIKTFSATAAIASGKYFPDSMIDTGKGWYSVGGHLVRDEHAKGSISLTQILQVSSNVGISKIILTLPPKDLWNLLHNMGFGESTGIGFPGERSGKLIGLEKLKPFALATLSFGYGISVTPLQLAHAYATLANGGVKVPLSLLKVDKLPQGERVVSKKVADTMLTVLQSVLMKGGTAHTISIPGYHISGKTGTAWIAGPHGYIQHHSNSSFVGIAPSTNPRVVIAVVIHDPQNKYHYMREGGYVAAPVFEKVMESALRIMNIPPDDPDSLPKNSA